MIGTTVSEKRGTMSESMDYDQRVEMEGIIREIEEGVLVNPEPDEEETDPVRQEAEDIAEAWGHTFPDNRFGVALANGGLYDGEKVGTLTVLGWEVADFVYAILRKERGIVDG